MSDEKNTQFRDNVTVVESREIIVIEENLLKRRNFLQRICDSVKKFFLRIFCRKKNLVEEEKKLRENLSEKKIDKMVKDSFPASDPPSTY